MRKLAIANPRHAPYGQAAEMALKRAGIPTELHIFASGDHDFGVRQNGKPPSSWTDLCLQWLTSRGLLK